MVDINKYVPKEIISRDIIKDRILPESIYCTYMGVTKIEIGKAIPSPLRDDSTPSFGFFKNNDGELLFNDFVKGGGDCFMFVKKFFLFDNWYDVYSRIALDFGLHHIYKCNESLDKMTTNTSVQTKRKIQVSRQEKCDIKVSRRAWNLNDFEYWNKFNIDGKTLRKYNVKPIQYIFFNEKPVGTDKHAYVYSENKDGEETLKIYQPFSEYKWFTNNDNSVWQGWTQLPQTGSKLIITKSLKDVMSIVNTTGIPAIGLQNEKAIPKEKIINQLKSRFDKIYVLFDNDFDKEENWGQLSAKKICRDHMLINIMIEEEYKSKDFSDLVMNYSPEFAKAILNNKINKNE